MVFILIFLTAMVFLALTFWEQWWRERKAKKR